MTMKYSSPYQAHMFLMLHNTTIPYNNIYISEFDKLSYLFLDAKLWNGTSLGGALGAEDLTTASAMMLPGHHSKLEKKIILFSTTMCWTWRMLRGQVCSECK